MSAARPWSLAAACVAIVGGTATCTTRIAPSPFHAPSARRSSSDPTPRVGFAVGCGECYVTWQVGMELEGHRTVTGSWSRSFKMKTPAPGIATLTAVPAQGSGVSSASITVNGKEVASSDRPGTRGASGSVILSANYP
jgi:hypothetical protein